MSDEIAMRFVSFAGYFALIAIAWAFSIDRRAFPWRIVVTGTLLQFALGLLLLKTPVGAFFFAAMNWIVDRFIGYTMEGTRFVFGALVDSGFSIVVHVLPVIVFSGSFFGVLYHLGVLQWVVERSGSLLARALRISGAESLAAVSNLFLGMTESALVVRPYLAGMTRSELFAVMTLGMATVAGSVMLAYVGMLGGGDYAGHLATASLLSLPAGLLLAKVLVPERESLDAPAEAEVEDFDVGLNLIDAASEGALAGLRLAGYVGALLIAFVALIALANDLIGLAGNLVGLPDASLEGLLGGLLAPLAWLLGVPWEDARTVGSLLGVKTILNEFIAYQQLAERIQAGAIAQRSAVIASYALCGFANFGSLAILLGGIGGLAPSRRADVARDGLRCILGGSLASFMTGAIAGMLL